jgi:hypothetical protein
MAYSLTTWQSVVRSQLDGWKQRMQGVGVTSLYNFLSAATLWPIVGSAIQVMLARKIRTVTSGIIRIFRRHDSRRALPG